MRFVLTSTAWAGQIVLEYNEAGLLLESNLKDAELSEQQHLWFLRNIPRELAELQVLIAKVQSAKLTPVPETITFDMFWDRYGEKLRSSRKKALTKWNRMSEADRAKAFLFIKKYENSMQAWQNKMYAETYLNRELWNN